MSAYLFFYFVNTFYRFYCLYEVNYSEGGGYLGYYLKMNDERKIRRSAHHLQETAPGTPYLDTSI